jgi:hypothetical protein
MVDLQHHRCATAERPIIGCDVGLLGERARYPE